MRVIMGWLVVLAACSEGSARVVRWPDHRHRHDAQLEQLLATTATQAQELAELEQRLAKLEEALRARTPPNAPQPPAERGSW